MDEIVEINSPEEMTELGEKMGLSAKPGDVFALAGDLGVGKTVFSKGMAKGLGIEDTIVSPTFTIVQEYKEGRLPFYHFDVYRIDEPDEMLEVGFDEYIRGDGVSLIEWADRIEGLLPKYAKVITIEKDYEKGNDYRRVHISK